MNFSFSKTKQRLKKDWKIGLDVEGQPIMIPEPTKSYGLAFRAKDKSFLEETIRLLMVNTIVLGKGKWVVPDYLFETLPSQFTEYLWTSARLNKEELIESINSEVNIRSNMSKRSLEKEGRLFLFLEEEWTKELPVASLESVGMILIPFNIKEGSRARYIIDTSYPNVVDDSYYQFIFEDCAEETTFFKLGVYPRNIVTALAKHKDNVALEVQAEKAKIMVETMSTLIEKIINHLNNNARENWVIASNVSTNGSGWRVIFQTWKLKNRFTPEQKETLVNTTNDLIHKAGVTLEPIWIDGEDEMKMWVNGKWEDKETHSLKSFDEL